MSENCTEPIDNSDEILNSFNDAVRLFTLEWNFLLEFNDYLFIPIAPEIEKFSPTLMEDKQFFANNIMFLKNLTNVQYGWSPNNLCCDYRSKEISIVYHAFETFKQFVCDHPKITLAELNNKNHPNKIKMMQFLIKELSKVVKSQTNNDISNTVLLISDIVTPVADFLGFDCLMNICDYVFNGASWVPCIFEECKYNTKLFITEKLDKSVPNLVLQFKNAPFKSKDDLYQRLLPRLQELPDQCRIPAFLKYACQVLVDPVISPNDSKFEDSCGIPYFCKTLSGETVIVDKLWLNQYDYKYKFENIKTLLSVPLQRCGKEYQYTSEIEDTSVINSLFE